MGFDYKGEKPLLNSSLICTASDLQTKSPSKDNYPSSESAIPTVQMRNKLNKYGHSLSNIAVSYHQAQLQTKLTIGKPGDKYEQEADKVSEQVMNMPEPLQRQQQREEQLQTQPSIQRQETGEEEKELQAKPLANAITPLVQRQAMPEDKEAQMKPSIQRQETGEEEKELQAKSEHSPLNTEGLEQQIGHSKGTGSPLSDEARSFMEPRFGTNFSDVKVHTDSSSVQMNQDIQAQAFTHGQDIYFNSGKYSPHTNEGKALLAHELTHVVQQRGAEKNHN